jgi:hypothetical protein
MTACPTCSATAPLRITHVPNGNTLITCVVCDTTLTLAELVTRAYLRGYEEGLADMIAEFREKEAKRNGDRPKN